ncbi:hypothetical protein SGRIM128S_08886 [Streptomyces griseomycini]
MRNRRIVTLMGAATLAGAVGLLPLSPAQAAKSDPAPPAASDFQKVTLNDRPGEPMALAVLPDSRVLHTARTGEVRIHDPESGVNFLAADMKKSPAGLYQHDEEGVQGIAVDPDFAKNHWVYLYYSPRLDTPMDDPATPGVQGPRRRDAPGVRHAAADFAEYTGRHATGRGSSWSARNGSGRLPRPIRRCPRRRVASVRVFVLTHHPEGAPPADGATFLSCDAAEAVRIATARPQRGKDLERVSRGHDRPCSSPSADRVDGIDLPVVPGAAR